MRSSHSLDRLSVQFDDDNLVADAGLILPATLAQHLGLRKLFSEHVSLPAGPGAANAGDKAMTVVSSLLAGGDCIDDADALRSGSVGQVLDHWVAAPSTLGTFLRAFTYGHSRQLDKVAADLLVRGWQSGAGSGGDKTVVDMDSTVCETYGLKKQGGSKFTYNHVRGYHPLLAVQAGTGDVVHSRFRGGPSHAGRGAAGFVTETVGRIRKAGAPGEIVIRADSGFYNHKVVGACRKAKVRFSITVKVMGKTLHQQFCDIPQQNWTPIPYFVDGAAVAEITYTPFATKKGSVPVRLIVRRVPPTPGSQLALFSTFAYHAFITDRTGDMLELETSHRAHAEVENTIRDLKFGMALNHFPSGSFAANAAWLTLNVIAHNLVRWTSRIGLGETLVTTKKVRRRFLSAPGRMTTSARKRLLHLPTDWPWADQFQAALVNLRAIRCPLLT